MDSTCLADRAWHTTLRRAWLFAYVPFVDFVLVGGSLALGTARRDSDIDVMVGTRAGRLYTARFFCLLLYTIAGWRRTREKSRDGFCFNYFISSAGALDALPAGKKNPRDEYERRLRASLVPIFGAPEIIQKFLERSGRAEQKWKHDLRYRYRENSAHPAITRITELLWRGHCGKGIEWFLKQWQIAVIQRFVRRSGNPEGARVAYTEDRVELCLWPKQWRCLDNTLKQDILISAMNIKPLSDHVFLEAIEEDRVTKSGIILPDTAEKERPIRGRVVAVGPGKRNDRGEISPLSVKVGDTVLFKKYGPDEIELDGKKYLVAEENEILGVLDNGGAGVSYEEALDILGTPDVQNNGPINPLNI